MHPTSSGNRMAKITDCLVSSLPQGIQFSMFSMSHHLVGFCGMLCGCNLELSGWRIPNQKASEIGCTNQELGPLQHNGIDKSNKKQAIVVA
eukprot:559447-Amphidinium_carterae.2